MTEYNYFPAIRFRFEGDEQAGHQYIPQARDLMAQMIRRMEAGETDVGSQEVTLPEGIRIRLEKYGDQHIVTIAASKGTPTAEEEEEKKKDTLCLMVLYDDDKIAAIPMSQLAKFPVGGTFSTAYTHQCTDSNWSPYDETTGPSASEMWVGVHFGRNKLLPCMQAKFNKDWPSVLHAAVALDGENHRVHMEQYSSCVSVINSDLSQYLVTETWIEEVPLINSDGKSSIYTAHDTLSVGSSGFKLTHKGDNPHNPYEIYGSPVALGQDGAAYYKLGVYLQCIQYGTYIRNTSDPRMDGWPYDASQQVHAEYIAIDALDQSGPINKYTNSSGFTVICVDTEEQHNFAYETDDGGNHIFEQDPDTSMGIPIVVSTQANGVDSFPVELEPLSGGSTLSSDMTEYISHLDFMGISEVYHSNVSDTYYEYTQFRWYQFPIQRDAKSPFYAIQHGTNTLPQQPPWTLYSPYGDSFEIESIQSGSVYAEDAFVPWMHISNGTHLIQGIGLIATVDGPVDSYIWLDGQRCEDAFASALKVNKNDIQMMVMDVPLSRIKQFK